MCVPRMFKFNVQGETRVIDQTDKNKNNNKSANTAGVTYLLANKNAWLVHVCVCMCVWGSYGAKEMPKW